MPSHNVHDVQDSWHALTCISDIVEDEIWRDVHSCNSWVLIESLQICCFLLITCLVSTRDQVVDLSPSTGAEYKREVEKGVV